MPTSPAPLALNVTLRWRDDALAFRCLQGDGAVAVGEHPDALAPIPCPVGLAGGFVFARVAGGAVTALAPRDSVITVWPAAGGVELVEGPATIALGAGDTAELRIGDFRFVARADVAEPLPRGRRRRLAGAWGAVAVAALAHAVVLGLAAQEARASIAEDREEERTDLLRGLLASAEMRARAADLPTEDGSGAGEGRVVNEARGDGRPGGGARAKGEEGAMGDRLGRAGPARRYAVPERLRNDREPSAARAEALVDAAQFGMIGLLGQGPAVPSATFADAWAHGADAVAASGAMWARLPGESGGAGGLGLTGIGEGGGGRGEGIGLGTVGTLGHTEGRAGPGTGGEGSALRGITGGSWGESWSASIGGIGHAGSHRSGPPSCRCGETSVSSRIPPEAIQRIVRQNFGRFRACYEAGLVRNPNLAGRVTTRFAIDHSGAVASAADVGSDLPDATVVACVVRAFSGISFPQPDSAIVTVTYPIQFSPPG